MPFRPNSPLQRRVILWIAIVAMVLLSAVKTVRYRTCVGDCCEPSEVAAVEHDCCGSSCDDAAPCCGCCEEGPDGDAGDDLDDEDPDCCITVAFDIELSKVHDAGVEMPAPELAFGENAFASFAAPPRAHAHRRPFERGPPRPPSATELRRTTVLLI